MSIVTSRAKRIQERPGRLQGERAATRESALHAVKPSPGKTRDLLWRRAGNG